VDILHDFFYISRYIKNLAEETRKENSRKGRN